MRVKVYVLIVAAVFIVFLSACGSDDAKIQQTDSQNFSDSDSEMVLPDSSNTDLDTGISDADDNSDTGDIDPNDLWNDLDEDGDGIPNGIEGKEDTDGDGIPDYKDDDSDGDGIPDSTETPNGVAVDTDNDGIPDYKDQDSDGDGIPDSEEGLNDFDGDGIPNYRDSDSDDDGLFDNIECPEMPCVDTDGDGMADYIDTDSDDDGIPDLYEGVGDEDKDGIPNFLDSDSDGDGILDYDENEENIPPLDSDNDGKPDFFDSDSDNDGLSDHQEVEFGSDSKIKDTDGDGTDDFTEFVFGSDPKDPQSNIPEDAYYIILPYESDPVVKSLDFSTDIKKVDVLIMVDLSGSMSGEHANLKSGIKTTIIDGVKAEIPDSAFGLVKFGTIEDQVYSMASYITTNPDTVKTAVDGISSSNGSIEYHNEALYQASTGAGTNETMDCVSTDTWGNCESGSISIPAANCSGKEGNIGGACFRNEALPIMIMASDESFSEGDAGSWTSGTRKTIDIAISAMNTINAKFIGIDSGASMSNFNTISDGTGSKDGSGNRFNYTINADGTGFSSQIVTAVVELTNNIQMDITTKPKHIDNTYGVPDTTKFIKSITPDSFPDVKPGQAVTFEVTFENKIYKNETYETKIFIANINVLGDGSFLDSRDVFIVVPGKDYTGPEH
ncbi:MAG TPA: hypothetical protein PKG52_09795 [bacterium]|nr:hypothetical protein [bacterium]HPS30988.1 hypothetical protein [bacterium]